MGQLTEDRHIKYCIYKITNSINQNIYIGSAINFYRRKIKHLTELKAQDHCNEYLQRSFNKYGREAFAFEVLEFNINPDILIEREQYYIDTFRPQYNICKTAGSPRGRMVSKETRDKIGIAHKNKIVSREARQRMSLSHMGQIVSEDRKNKLKESMKNNKFALNNINRRKVNGKTYKDIIDLHGNGYGCRRIAKITNLSKSTILNVFNKRFNYDCR